MAEITAAMIKELRERTGIGMGKCKEALEVAHGDMDLAIENLAKQVLRQLLRKKGVQPKRG